MRRAGEWLQLGGGIMLFTAFLTYIAITYAAVAGYEWVTGRKP
jgi:hypothetical protein